MKSLTLVFPAAIMLIYACSSRKQNESDSGNGQDTVVTAEYSQEKLTAKMRASSAVKAADSVILRFTVYNRTDKDLVFCKWHTPFEPPMSKFLDIIDENGNEVQYKGAMAKRVMPPPPDSYIKVKARDSLSTTFDLQKYYLIDRPGTYQIKYNSESISKLAISDTVTLSRRK